jgi:hypothetical protein
LIEHLFGRIETFPLADVLQWLEVQGATGRLTVRRGADGRKIDWKGGEIVYVSGVRSGDRLGQSLASEGLVPAIRLYEIFARQFVGKRKLSRILLDEGLVPRRRLAAFVRNLAQRLLVESLSWPDGTFSFDPTYATEDVFHVPLRIRSQAVALQAAKQRDDSTRSGRGDDVAAGGLGWEIAFDSDNLADLFWKTREACGETPFEVESERIYHRAFRDMAAALHARLASPLTFMPVFEDTRHHLREMFDIEAPPGEVLARLAGVIRLDPFFALDLLQLANSLVVPEGPVASVADALERVGMTALREMVEGLSQAGRELAPQAAIPRTLRRAALAAAYASESLAEQSGQISPADAYTGGLLHVVPYLDILDSMSAASFPPGRFRSAAIEAFRPIVGRVRSHMLGLPMPIQAVIAEDEREPLAELVGRGRRSFPRWAVGSASASPDRNSLPEARRNLERAFRLLDLGDL